MNSTPVKGVLDRRFEWESVKSVNTTEIFKRVLKNSFVHSLVLLLCLSLTLPLLLFLMFEVSKRIGTLKKKSDMRFTRNVYYYYYYY